MTCSGKNAQNMMSLSLEYILFTFVGFVGFLITKANLMHDVTVSCDLT